MKIDTSDMTVASRLTDPDELALTQQAKKFISSFSWCSRVLAMYSAFNLADKIGVSLARIKPRQKGVDEMLWLVVGDLPPAYLVCDDATNFLEALQCYVREMDRWVAAVQSGAVLDGIIPVNVPPTAENADLLARRLKFIRENVLHGEWEKS